MADDPRFGVFNGRVFHVLEHLASVATYASVERHLQFTAAQAIRRARPADGMTGIGAGNGAGQRRIDDGVDRAARVHKLPSDGQLGATGKRPARRVDRLDDGIDELVIVGRLAFEIGDADDDRPASRFDVLRAVDETDDASRLDVELFVRMAGHAGHGDASSDVGKCFAQIDTFNGHVGAAFPGPQSRVKTFHLSKPKQMIISRLFSYSNVSSQNKREKRKTG